MTNYSDRMNQIRQEIRDLKTSQLTQSSSQASIVKGTIPINLNAGSNTWTITYKSSDDESEPLLEVPNSTYFRISILKYNQSTNAQQLQLYLREAETRSVEDTFFVVSSRPIQSIVRNF